MAGQESDADDTPLSRPIKVRDIGEAPEPREITATPAERAALAEWFNIPRITSVVGRFVLEPGRRGRVLATLRLSAVVTRTCVVSLDEFDSRIEEEVKLIFVPADDMAETDDDPESPDEIPFDGAVIDLGAALAEQLALALDPYPRKPEVALPGEAQEARENPFAAFFGESGRRNQVKPEGQ